MAVEAGVINDKAGYAVMGSPSLWDMNRGGYEHERVARGRCEEWEGLAEKGRTWYDVLGS